MPWPKEHKSQTRARIVAAAATALRAKGVGGVSLADIMATVKLTHGGFYAHFQSKDDLLAKALDHASRQTLKGLSGSPDSAPATRHLWKVVDAYLSPWHAAHPELGCPVAAVGPEIARADGTMRRKLRRGIRERLHLVRGLIPGNGRTESGERQAVGVLACMVGGLILARVVGGKESAVLLEACRGFLRSALDDSPAVSIAPSAPRTERALRRRSLS